MPLVVLQATHVRVTCDACRAASAELCGKRELEERAVVSSMRRFLAEGWHHDPVARGGWKAKTRDQIEHDGSGRWYCPPCSKTAR